MDARDDKLDYRTPRVKWRDDLVFEVAGKNEAYIITILLHEVTEGGLNVIGREIVSFVDYDVLPVPAHERHRRSKHLYLVSQCILVQIERAVEDDVISIEFFTQSPRNRRLANTRATSEKEVRDVLLVNELLEGRFQDRRKDAARYSAWSISLGPQRIFIHPRTSHSILF